MIDIISKNGIIVLEHRKRSFDPVFDLRRDVKASPERSDTGSFASVLSPIAHRKDPGKK